MILIFFFIVGAWDAVYVWGSTTSSTIQQLFYEDEDDQTNDTELKIHRKRKENLLEETNKFLEEINKIKDLWTPGNYDIQASKQRFDVLKQKGLNLMKDYENLMPPKKTIDPNQPQSAQEKGSENNEHS